MKKAPQEYDGLDPDKDLHENRILYENESYAADQTLTIHSDAEHILEPDDAYADSPLAALKGLLGQYQKDLLFERDKHTRQELKDQIAALEAEIEYRTEVAHDRFIRDALSAQRSATHNAAKAEADVKWRQIVKAAA